MNKRFLHALVLSFCGLLAATVAAHAAGGVASIGKAWVISPVQSPSNPDRRYCSLTQGYSNGISLVYAQEQTGAGALALEFSTDVMREGKNISLRLSSGAFVRDIEVMPVSSRAIVVQLGVDGALRNALLQPEAVLGAGLSGKTVASFRMDRADEAFAALDACVKAVSGGKMPGPVHIETGSTTVKIIDKSVYEESPQQQTSAPQGEVTRRFKEIAWPQTEKFEDVSAAYISSEAARCTADFAHKVAAAVKGISGPVMKAEIACMGHDNSGVVSERDYAGALLFVGKSGKMEVVSFEGPALMLPEALTKREAAYMAVTTP